MSIFENNRELLDRFRGGDRAALVEVYEAYVDDVATLARRGFTMEAHGHVYVAGFDAQDEYELVQDTFLRAFGDKARISFDGLRPYRPFLLRITKNLMIDRLRARRAQGRQGGVGDIDEVLESNTAVAVIEDPAEDLHWDELSAKTADFLAELDQEARDVIRLRFEDDLSQDAVAERLGCSRRRVRTLEARVQKRLQRHLRKLGLLDS